MLVKLKRIFSCSFVHCKGHEQLPCQKMVCIRIHDMEIPFFGAFFAGFLVES